MGYEIPQKLEYKEKIIFGLTFKQLAYLLLFAPLIFAVSIGSNMHILFKVFFSMNLSAMAVGFIFLDLDKHLRIWIAWFKTRVIETPKQLLKFIPIKEIRDELLVTNDGRKIAVLKITPVNFSIKPQTAKESIIIAFQKFLNSLDFPIQIIMNTEKLDLQEYLNEVDKKIEDSGQFRELFEEYKAHLISLSSQNDVMNRNFYLMIPEKSDIEIQVKICQDKLANLGLKNTRVNDKGLRELLEKFFETEGENPFSKFFERMADSSVRSVFPTRIENYPSHIKIGDTFSRTIYASGYPRNVEAGFLDKIVSSQGDFDLSLYVEPYNIETTMVMLNRELMKQRADLYSAKLKGSLNPSLEIKYEDTKAVLRNLQKGEEKLFNISLYINCRAKTKEKLDLLTKKIEAELNSLMIIPKLPMFRMAQGFQSCSPLALDSLKMNRNVTTKALSAFFPFTSSFLQADKTGVWLGQNRNNIPIIKDIFKLSNPNGICLASSGSGKSYMAKLLISRYLLNGVKVMVIDPQGEYRGLVERFKGQRVDLSRTSETMINPLDLMGHDYAEKRLALMDLMPIMLGDLTEPQKSFIDRALTEAYELNGITDKPETWNNH